MYRFDALWLINKWKLHREAKYQLIRWWIWTAAYWYTYVFVPPFDNRDKQEFTFRENVVRTERRTNIKLNLHDVHLRYPCLLLLVCKASLRPSLIVIYQDFHSTKLAPWLGNSWSRAPDPIRMYPDRDTIPQLLPAPDALLWLFKEKSKHTTKST